MPTFLIPQLESFAQALLSAAGMDEAKAQTVARLLVLTDAMGRRTHGLAMAALYLADIEKGGMTVSGEMRVVKYNGISAVWDGNYLPGRMPGDQAARGLVEALERGIAHDEPAWQALAEWRIALGSPSLSALIQIASNLVESEGKPNGTET